VLPHLEPVVLDVGGQRVLCLYGPRGVPRPIQRRGDHRVASPPGERLRRQFSLPPAVVVQVRVVLALETPQRVPVGLAVPHEQKPGHAGFAGGRRSGRGGGRRRRRAQPALHCCETTTAGRWHRRGNKGPAAYEDPQHAIKIESFYIHTAVLYSTMYSSLHAAESSTYI
jgi:hypothetical protein